MVIVLCDCIGLIYCSFGLVYFGLRLFVRIALLVLVMLFCGLLVGLLFGCGYGCVD